VGEDARVSRTFALGAAEDWIGGGGGGGARFSTRGETRGGVSSTGLKRAVPTSAAIARKWKPNPSGPQIHAEPGGHRSANSSVAAKSLVEEDPS
jgi:hypothetical protein